jgi:ABC-2 type transport system ATP-binding protein
VALEVAAGDSGEVKARLEKVPGVGGVALRDTRHGHFVFEIESQPGENVRTELARAVIESGWQLYELKNVALSLEEVFLELTASAPAQEN